MILHDHINYTVTTHSIDTFRFTKTAPHYYGRLNSQMIMLVDSENSDVQMYTPLFCVSSKLSDLQNARDL